MRAGGLDAEEQFSEHQIIAILKAVEAGRTIKDVCREHEISDATYYQWKSKYGACKLLTSSACVNWKKKTDGLSRSPLTYYWRIER
jgi:transposase-like protein